MSKSPYSASDHFDGERFHNLEEGDTGLWDLLRLMVSRRPSRWPRWVPSEPAAPPPARVEGKDLRITFINHASFLIQTGGINILTDPIWSKRCSPLTWAGPRRVRAPGLRLDDLPPIHAVLISHNHYDHFDVPTVRELKTRFAPIFISTLGNAPLLRAQGCRETRELDWWDEQALAPEVRVLCTPARHFSARSLRDRNRTLWGGFWLSTPAGSIFFAGDTAYGSHFVELKKRLGSPRVALLPIGAYHPRWFMRHHHMDPAEALQAHLDLGSQQSIGMHFGTFALAKDGWNDPPRELSEVLRRAQVPAERFSVLDFGGHFSISHAQ